MKSKTLTLLDEYNENVENTVFEIGLIDLGNNFDYCHFFDALTECQRDFLQSIANSLDLAGNARIKFSGNYGNTKLNVSVYDLCDFLR